MKDENIFRLEVTGNPESAFFYDKVKHIIFLPATVKDFMCATYDGNVPCVTDENRVFLPIHWLMEEHPDQLEKLKEIEVVLTEKVKVFDDEKDLKRQKHH